MNALQKQLIDALVPLQQYAQIKKLIGMLEQNKKYTVPEEDYAIVFGLILLISLKIPTIMQDSQKNENLRQLAIHCYQHLETTQKQKPDIA